eukprot:XP_011667984.1 PREDICTED: cytochrome P450 2C15 [Strongylocentrotus purpuratus]
MESLKGYVTDWWNDMGIITSLLFGLFGSVIVFGIVRQTFGKREKLPPGPLKIPFPLNIIASLFSKEGKMDMILSAKRKYGDLVSIEIDGQPKILVGSPELVRELFVKHGDVSSSRAASKPLKAMINYTGGIIFGESWQPLRRFSLSALRTFGMGKRSIASKITEEARIFTDGLWESQTVEGVNPSGLLNKAISNVICSITFGKRFEYSDPDYIIQVENIKKIMAGGNIPPVLRIVAQRFPVIFRSPLSKNAKKRLQSLKDFIVQQVDEHDRTFEGDDIRDIVDSFLAECRRLQEKGEQECYIRKEDIWMSVWELFIAGTETTASALAWFFLFMAAHPDIQEQVFKEIVTTIGSERAPVYDDRKNMPYTEATLAEVLRHRPVAPFGLPHVADETIHVRDYVIPKGSTILANILGIHHDPELFPEPSKFDPNRFLSDDGQTFVKNDAYTAFGLGRRSCLGEQLAKMEFFLFATSVLQRFTIRLPAGATPDYSIGHRMMTLLPSDFYIHLDKR